ncbi:MAG: hypothetical protein ACYTJ0_00455 [Planctomycetota bacterium]
MTRRTLLLAPLAAALLLGAVGCKSGPSRINTRDFTVQVDVGSTLRGDTVAVDLVGVTENEKARWDSVSMSEYFSPRNTLRDSAKSQGIVHTMDFRGSTTSGGLPQSAPEWAGWRQRQALYLYVLADLPPDAGHQDQPGEADARRLIFKLDELWWAKNAPGLIQVSVERGGLSTDTPNLPERR